MNHVNMVNQFLDGDTSELIQIQRTMNINATGNMTLAQNIAAKIKTKAQSGKGVIGKTVANTKATINEIKTNAGIPIKETPTPEPSPVPEKEGINWLLWGGIGGGVILLAGIGVFIWYKNK